MNIWLYCYYRSKYNMIGLLLVILVMSLIWNVLVLYVYRWHYIHTFIDQDFQVNQLEIENFQRWSEQQYQSDNVKSLFDIEIGGKEVIFSKEKNIWIRISVVNIDDRFVDMTDRIISLINYNVIYLYHVYYALYIILYVY